MPRASFSLRRLQELFEVVGDVFGFFESEAARGEAELLNRFDFLAFLDEAHGFARGGLVDEHFEAFDDGGPQLREAFGGDLGGDGAGFFAAVGAEPLHQFVEHGASFK